MPSARFGFYVFSMSLIGVGAIGLFREDLIPAWTPVPGTGSVHELLVYLIVAVCLISGAGLLVHRTAAVAARLLLSVLVVWLLALRMPNFFTAPPFAACWSVFPLLVMLTAALARYTEVATPWDIRHIAALSGESGRRLAQLLYGLSLVFFGAAHFIDLKDTVTLVPHWLPFPNFWAYLTGSTYIAAGIAIAIGVLARPAAVLSAVQIASFLFLVWVPIISSGSASPFQWREILLNEVLLASAWVIADSYRAIRTSGTSVA